MAGAMAAMFKAKLNSLSSNNSFCPNLIRSDIINSFLNQLVECFN